MKNCYSGNLEFGWIAGGRLQETKTNDFSCFLLKHNDPIEDTSKLSFELESLGIKDEPCYREDYEAMNVFKETVWNNNNQYVVELPFRKDWNGSSENFSVAKQLSQELWRKLQGDEAFNTQCKKKTTILDYLNQEIIEKIEKAEIILLENVMKIYDPLGLLSPFTKRIKFLIQ
ncbi:uncharacterized protein TNCT_433741 [Trichonephila clavata]|uniref:Uncharacterized protein n=1 Tax=Trichonephila clavata TaxID=2740835 RepID=A0A8X6FGL1_TRICU|nr:uncharacterized protein TNCT_433741 [Trichonephila clavata]